MDKRDKCAEVNEEMLFCDGLDDALLGVGSRFGMPEPVAIYDYDKCVQVLVDDGLTYEEADEYLQFNTLGAWVGENTPIFIRLEENL